MTFSKMSAAGKDTIRPFGKSAHNKGRVYTPSTHHPDDAQIRRILITLNTGSVGGGVTTPMA
jgi:hypothetical protein